MRPANFHNRISSFNAATTGSSIPGLSPQRGLDYNHRQKLPSWNGPAWGSDESPLPVGAAMASSRKSTTNPSGGAESPHSSGGMETRTQRLERIRREIQAGTYETPEKLDAAIERMMGILVD